MARTATDSLLEDKLLLRALIADEGFVNHRNAALACKLS